VSVIAVIKQIKLVTKCNVCFEPRPCVVLTVDCGDRRIELAICIKCLSEMIEKLRASIR